MFYVNFLCTRTEQYSQSSQSPAQDKRYEITKTTSAIFVFAIVSRSIQRIMHGAIGQRSIFGELTVVLILISITMHDTEERRTEKRLLCEEQISGQLWSGQTEQYTLTQYIASRVYLARAL